MRNITPRVRVLLVLLLCCFVARGQETYQNASLLGNNLSGTARYVGLGGAMEALGADISVIHSNPAGLGLAQRTSVSASLGYSWVGGGDASHLTLEQFGAVLHCPLSYDSYMNLAVNYNRTNDYWLQLAGEGALSGASQNKNAYLNLSDAQSNGGSSWLNNSNVSQLDALYYWNFTGDEDGYLYYNDATRFYHSATTKGCQDSFDVSVSGNIGSQVFYGVTMGIQDLSYRSWATYTEDIVNSEGSGIGSITVDDYREVSGAGFDFSLGLIWFPIYDSPFRIGASISTPTWYDLTTYNYSTFSDNSTAGGNYLSAGYASEGEYDYRVYTPWKWGLSLGHILQNNIALGLSYEYADYGSTSSRVLEYGDFEYLSSYKDETMNAHTKQTLRGVHTLKLGAEGWLDDNFVLRVGYNYVSPMYNKNGYKDTTLESWGTYYASRSDFVNWGAINRFCLGAGVELDSFGFDLAYQYTTQKGTYYPCMSESDNPVSSTALSYDKHKITATLTYKF